MSKFKVGDMVKTPSGAVRVISSINDIDGKYLYWLDNGLYAYEFELEFHKDCK